MAAKNLPDAVYLRECLDYDPGTGALTWKHRPREHFPSDHVWRVWIANFAGKRAGAMGDRYVKVVLDNKWRLYGHRIIWAMQTGEWPAAEIDHRNHDRTDNRWCNLRTASRYENARNRPGWRGHNLPKGVTQSRHHYAAYGNLDGKTVYLGVFDAAEDAHAAYRAFSADRHGEFFSAERSQDVDRC